MLKNSMRSVVSSCSAALFIAALGTNAFAVTERPPTCRDLQADIRAIRLAVGVLDDKLDQSNAGLEFMQAELQRILIAIEAQGIGGLQLEVAVDETACASGGIQCASGTLPSSSNQIPVAINLLVLNRHEAVTNLEIAGFNMLTAFTPNGGASLAHCTDGGMGCGSAQFFVNRGDGTYQLWVHPPTTNWVRGTYTLLLRVTDTVGNVATKTANVTVGPGNPGPGSEGPGGSQLDTTQTDVQD